MFRPSIFVLMFKIYGPDFFVVALYLDSKASLSQKASKIPITEINLLRSCHTTCNTFVLLTALSYYREFIQDTVTIDLTVCRFKNNL